MSDPPLFRQTTPPRKRQKDLSLLRRDVSDVSICCCFHPVSSAVRLTPRVAVFLSPGWAVSTPVRPCEADTWPGGHLRAKTIFNTRPKSLSARKTSTRMYSNKSNIRFIEITLGERELPVLEIQKDPCLPPLMAPISNDPRGAKWWLCLCGFLWQGPAPPLSSP